MLVSVEPPPSRSLTLLALWAAENVSLTLFSQVTCAEAAPAAPLLLSCDLVPWRLTYSEEVRVGSSGARIPWPPPGACGRNSLGFVGFVRSVFVLDIIGRRAAKASMHSFGVRCMSRAVGRLSRWRARQTAVGGVCWAFARCQVVRGGPLGQGGLAWGCCSLPPVRQLQV